jgi:PAS domain S-box-containing protein
MPRLPVAGRYAAQTGLLATAYWASAKLSLFLAIPPGYATAIWPASGIALAGLLVFGTRAWPAVWIGSFAANLTVEASLAASMLIAAGSSLQAAVAAMLVRRLIGVPYRFERANQVVMFAGVAVLSSVIAPTFGVLHLAAMHALSPSQLFWNWWTWWQGDACGMLLAAPLVLSWSVRGSVSWTLPKMLEAVALAALLVATSELAFTGDRGRTFIVVPLIVWVAFRFGQREVTTAIAVVCAMATWNTLQRQVGPFATQPLNETLLVLLLFVSTMVLTGLMLSAVLLQLQRAMVAVRRRAEGMLLESERRFRLMVESVVDYAIFMLDAEGRVASWNAGAQRILGYHADEIIGESVASFYPPAERALGKPEREIQLASVEGRFEEEAWRVRKDRSEFRAHVVVTAVRDDDGRLLGFAKVTRDLTERAHVEAELIRAKVAAERASEAKSQFLANMSHELRTPLNSLLILARLLADNQGGNLSPKQVRFAQTIHASGMDLLSLINDVLDLAKIESGAMNSIDIAAARLDDLAADLEHGFRQVAQDKGVQFAIHIDPTAPSTIRTDMTRVKQVLKNLLANAFKFTKAGSVTLRIAPDAPGWIAFSVNDTGIGIAEDKQQVIFEAFQQADGTTSRHYGGTGLGLSISRELARLLGGEIRLVSRAGEGSTFTLRLPIASEARTTGAT